MKFGSLFSGIGGFDLGFEQAGIECAWQCEIDKYARSVLKRHWPDVPCMEDVRNVRSDNVPAVDLICGGFPCQDLSVAGKRAGLAGERSGLWFEFHRVIADLRPQWVVIENVPGLLSSHRGADFAVILRGLVECGYGVAWRILDAQYFGVAQRRRRVFVVGSLGDGRASEILFERDGLFGDSPARRKAKQRIAGTLESRTNGGGFPGTDGAISGHVVPAYGPQTFDWQAGVAADDRTEIMDKPGRTRSLSASRTLAIFGGNNTSGEIDVATAVNAHGGSGRMDFESETLVFEPRYARNGRGAPDTIAPPLKAQNGGTGKGDGAPVVLHYAHDYAQDRIYGDNGPAPALAVSNTRRQQSFNTSSGVRRLTPTECERLQGFPDGWTKAGVRIAVYSDLSGIDDEPEIVGWTTIEQSDSARYRQLGNAVAVPVARWIGERIVSHA